MELSTICNPPNTCTLQDNYPDITNHAHFKGGIDLNNHTITNFTNYGTLGNIAWGGGNITHITNYGTMGYIAGIRTHNPTPTTMSVTNYGIMGGIETQYGNKDIFIANYGVINPTNNNIHFWGTSSNQYYFVIVDYAMVITESASVFANSKSDTSGNNNSHIVLHSQGLMRFNNPNSKIILDFGGNFDFGVAYPLDKLIIDSSGENRLKVGFDRLATRSSLYKLTQSGDSFIATIDAPNSEIGILHKSNIRTMNNFYTLSNSMIYPHKYKSKRIVRKRKVIRKVKKVGALETNESFSYKNNSNNLNNSIKSLESLESLETLESLQSHESFAYKNDSNNSSNSIDSTTYTNQNNINHIRIANINQTIPNANERNQITDSTNHHRIATKQTINRNRHSTNRQAKSTQSNQMIPTTQSTPPNTNYHFILTPFINHNLFFETGRYNLSGLEYGFLTAFSGKITPNNALGTHFMMSYGTLEDSKDKDFSITNLNLNVGLNYKFDMIWDMYLKARGDFYYFLNQVKTLTMFEAIKPNNLGFGASVAYGKEWDFRQGGVLGLEAGIDYKALQSSTISLQNSATKTISETYQKSLYNLIYVDLGMSYNKYFGNFGLNATLGLKGNITANKLATSKIHISTFNKSVDMVLDNDNFLAYANAGISYLLNHKNFDMEFSLAYYGNFGDRVISNGGGVEWRVGF